MTEEEAFLQAIIDAPDDDVLRLIYADWLEEHGKSERAEFIRVQCALACIGEGDPRCPALLARERDLRSAHEKEWVKPLRPWVMEWSFRRGLVEEITAPAFAFINQGPIWFRHFPIQHARVLKVVQCPEQFFGLRQLARLRTLVLERDYREGDKVVGPLAACPHLGSLTHLTLTMTVGRASGRALAASPHLRSLTHLALSYEDVSTEGFWALFDSPVVERLTTLRFSGWIGSEELRYLLTTPRLARLRCLVLGAPRLGELITETLPAVTPTFRLNELDLGRGPFGHAGMPELAASALLKGVLTLALNWNSIDAMAVRQLTTSSHLDSLQSLSLEHNQLGDPGARVLAEWPGLQRLTRLDLQNNDIRADGATALAESPYLGPTLRVSLARNRMSENTRRRLQQRLGDRFDFQE